jgi:hypothetical protein
MILPDFIAHYFGSDKGDRTMTMYRDGRMSRSGTVSPASYCLWRDTGNRSLWNTANPPSITQNRFQ